MNTELSGLPEELRSFLALLTADENIDGEFRHVTSHVSVSDGITPTSHSGDYYLVGDSTLPGARLSSGGRESLVRFGLVEQTGIEGITVKYKLTDKGRKLVSA